MTRKKAFDATSLWFYLGLFIFININLFTAFNLELHFDESYYWLYSQKPALGYFDHPPLNAWLIHLGYSLLDSNLGVRLVHLILSALAMLFLWKTLDTEHQKPFLFWALIFSVLFLVPYAFVATPDGPLLFFSILFLYIFKHYLKTEESKYVFLLALTSGGMIYTKYHAFLFLGLVFIANIRLIKTKNFWLYTTTLLLLMVPHLFWQISHNFVSFRYHLVDSHQNPYKVLISLEYLASQALFLGPFLSWLMLSLLIRKKVKSAWELTLKVVGLGVPGTFLFLTVAGDFEPHWTLIAVPAIVLFTMMEIKKDWQKRLVYWSGLVSFSLMLLLRISIFTPFESKIPFLQIFNGWEEESIAIQNVAEKRPVVFINSWNKAAQFAWHTRNENVAHLSSPTYRHTQFSLWKNEKQYEQQEVILFTTEEHALSGAKILQTQKHKWFYKTVENFRKYEYTQSSPEAE